MKHLDFTKIYKLIHPLSNIHLKGTNRISKIISSLLIPTPDKNGSIIKTLHNFKMHVDPIKDNGVEKSLYFLGTYEKGTLHIIENILKTDDFFVDVGANIGLISIFASQKIGKQGRVLAFEANPETKKILEFNLELNGIHNVSISGFALGSQKGEGKIYFNWHVNRGAASLIKSEKSSEYHPVQIIRLDQYKETDLCQISLMKIDVEGFELEVLKGCGDILKGENAPMLIIECSSGRENFQSGTHDIFHYLKNVNQYRVYKLRKGKERISKLMEITDPSELPHHDNIFCFLNNKITSLPGSIL